MPRLRSTHSLPSHIAKIIGSRSPVANANCLNAALFFSEVKVGLEATSPTAFIAALRSRYRQLESNELPRKGDVLVVWSPPQEVKRIDVMNRDLDFGNPVRHAAVVLDTETVFQKRSTAEQDPYEVTDRQRALAPFLEGHTVLTYHRLGSPKPGNT